MIRLEAQRGTEAPFLVSGNQDGMVWESRVDPGFFDVFELPIVAGRGFTPADAGTPTVVVNESLARNLGGSPLGMYVRYPSRREGDEPSPWHEVVGVVTNAGMNPTDRGEADFVYHPGGPADLYPGYVGVRVQEGGARLAALVPSLVPQMDPALRVYDVLMLDELVKRRALGGITAMIAVNLVILFALLLSAAGLFALMAVAVERRTREIGIRLALGATPRAVLGAVFARAATQLGLGILIGNLLVMGLFGVLSASFQPLDLLPRMGAISALMALVGLGACAVPARRVLRVQPTDAIKGVG
jgi:ABC-type antimicrobial peptide transport system permease subunit